MAKKTAKDYAAILTSQVIKVVEEGGALPWRKSWNASTRPRNAVTGRPYNGVNVMVCLIGQIRDDHPTARYLTKSQMRKLGTWFRKGQRPVWLWRPLTRKVEDKETGETRYITYGWGVFPAWNVGSLKDGFDESQLWQPPEGNDNDPITGAERIVDGFVDAPNRRAGKPAYVPSRDTVYVPPIGDFEGSEEYYSTLFHELTHSTGHESRLAREGVMNVNRFGSQSYSREELVAEIGAAILCGEAGISQAVLDNQVAYTRGWLKYLGDHPQALVDAASAAQKAADYITG